MTAPPPSPHDEPLSLSVHTLPDLAHPEFVHTPPSGRGKLLSLALACSLPIVLAYLIFFIVKPTGPSSFGELIHPARPMPAVTLLTPQGQNVTLDSLQKQWLLVSVGPSQCDDACAQHLFIQRQLREMLNKDKDRVDRVWLTTDDGPIHPKISPLLGDLTILRATPEVLHQWLGADSDAATQSLFVIDPQGHAMLKMPADLTGAEAKSAMRVLQKLLMASVAWDAPGR